MIHVYLKLYRKNVWGGGIGSSPFFFYSIQSIVYIVPALIALISFLFLFLKRAKKKPGAIFLELQIQEIEMSRKDN